jgi:hypothetical protein
MSFGWVGESGVKMLAMEVKRVSGGVRMDLTVR